MATGGTTDRPEPGPNEMFCSECGSIIDREAEMCPECGVSHAGTAESRFDARTWLIIGAVAGVVGFVIFGVVLGPAAIFAGYKAFKGGSETGGVVVMVVGIVDLLGWALVVVYLQPGPL